jgi:hypothetical protein
MKSAHERRLSVLDAIKLLRHPLGLLSLVAIVGLAVAEIAWQPARHLFVTYPVTMSLLTTLITLAFSLSIVNELVLQRTSRRWADVRGITLKGFNDEIRSTRDLLWIAIFGEPPYRNSNQMVRMAADTAKESGVSWPSEANGLFTAITKVLSDGHWTKTGAAILEMATCEIREGLAQWAPTANLAGGDYRALSPIASLADIIEVLEFPLARSRWDQACSVADKYRQPLCMLWCHALATCVYVEENIVKVLHAEGGWKSAAREMLSDSETEDLEQWLADPVIFERDTLSRKEALLRLIPKPW